MYVTGGIDTHRDFHVAAAKDQLGRTLGTHSFPSDHTGHAALLAWLQGWGELTSVGIEGTGSYGAGLARYLTAHHIPLIEVDRPHRRTRRRSGKTDDLDAINAARAVQAGDATTTPKTRTGPIESVRALRAVRDSAVKTRTATINQLHALIITAPQQVRTHLSGHHRAALIRHCAGLDTGLDTGLDRDPAALADPDQATRLALHALARRIQSLDSEISVLDAALAGLLARIAPATLALHGVGPHTAGQLLTTAGDNPERVRSEAAFAHLCGAAPVPACSGNTDQHRLNRGGDRQANKALYRIALVRMRHHQPTRDYVRKRTAEGKSKKAIIRCLKRLIAREVYYKIIQDLAPLKA